MNFLTIYKNIDYRYLQFFIEYSEIKTFFEEKEISKRIRVIKLFEDILKYKIYCIFFRCPVLRIPQIAHEPESTVKLLSSKREERNSQIQEIYHQTLVSHLEKWPIPNQQVVGFTWY